MASPPAPCFSSLSKLTKPSSSFRLRNPSLNTLRLRRIFDLFDCNGDGLITPSELSQALDRLGLSPSDPSEVSSLLSPFLTSSSSIAGLDFDAFQALHRSLGDALFGAYDDDDDNGGLRPIKEEEEADDMAEAFRVFDQDGDGFISARELQRVLEKLGLKEGESLERVHDMIGSVDCNNDGRVDFVEFKDMMSSVVANAS